MAKLDSVKTLESRQHVSPRELGEAIGVSMSTLKRWVDRGLLRAPRTAGGHRRIPLCEAIRFIRETGLPVRNPAAIGLAELPPTSEAPTAAAPADTLTHALKAGRDLEARNVITCLFLSGEPLARLFDDLICPAMNAVGDCWRGDDAEGGILIEHRATDAVLATLAHLRTLLPPPAPTAPAAVGGAWADDPYLLPSLMASLVLAEQGWRSVNLGPQTPPAVLRRAADEHDARLVWVCVKSVATPAALCEQLTHLAGSLAERGAHLAVGGDALPRRLSAPAPNVHRLTTMSELSALAAGMQRPSEPGPR